MLHHNIKRNFINHLNLLYIFHHTRQTHHRQQSFQSLIVKQDKEQFI